MKFVSPISEVVSLPLDEITDATALLLSALYVATAKSYNCTVFSTTVTVNVEDTVSSAVEAAFITVSPAVEDAVTTPSVTVALVPLVTLHVTSDTFAVDGVSVISLVRSSVSPTTMVLPAAEKAMFVMPSLELPPLYSPIVAPAPATVGMVVGKLVVSSAVQSYGGVNGAVVAIS